MRIMFLGTSSNSGKTTMAAMLCRYAALRGIRTAPFKASNLSSQAHMTDAGIPVGIGQALQAAASGIPPEPDMNPVLLRSEGGKVARYLKGRPCGPSDDVLAEALASFDSLAGRFDLLVCEGSGSPVELNVRDDIANMVMVRERDIPAVIVGDIERGGVFAAIYGTWKLIPEEDRRHLRGFIINRFRGDMGLLDSGIGMLESMTGMKCFGIVPYADIGMPEEDTHHSGESYEAGLESIDRLIEACEDSADLEGLLRVAGHQ